MKITTKKGDGGRTKLCGGRPVPKCDPKVKALGALDELSCFLGIAKVKAADNATREKLGLIQKDLFRIMGSISAGSRSGGSPVKDRDIRMLEQFGDAVEAKIKMPPCFIIPGTNESSAFMHAARAVARRAECSVVELGGRAKAGPCVLAYLNRLSDLLFILAVSEERKHEPA